MRGFVINSKIDKFRKSTAPNFVSRQVAPVRTDVGKFENLGISRELLSVISRLNFTEPTPVQEQSIPVGIEGHDIIAIAQTGTGKTIAFGVPMLQRLGQMQNGSGLIVVPTRELALQVDEALQPFCRAKKILTAVIIGGASMELQFRDLKKNPRILIATPGRLLDHLERKTITLAHVQVLVLDEADRMLDMGFAPDIKKIIGHLPHKHQTMLFSATMPDEIFAIAKKHMTEPVHIEIARSGSSPDEISHEMFFVERKDKNRLLEVQLRDREGSVLVFTRTKHGATKLARSVACMGYTSAQIHSNRSLGQRRDALEGFKSGKYRVLVATDIAARGIDVSEITMVINYDLPSTSEDYVHRIGRTGRAGKNGHAVSFATYDQKRDVKNIEKFIKFSLPVSALPILPPERKMDHMPPPASFQSRPPARNARSNGFKRSRFGRRKSW
jgi:ATP-dependent RNA helicase RhlE